MNTKFNWQNKTLSLLLTAAIFTVGLVSTAAAQISPVVQVRVGTQDRYYQVIRNSSGLSQVQAFTAAGARFYNGRRGNLATLSSEHNEYRSVIFALKSHGVDLRDIWLAGNRGGDSSVCKYGWTWADGRQFSSSYWAPGEPNNPGGGNNGRDCTGLRERGAFIYTADGFLGNLSPNGTRGGRFQMGYMVEYGN